MYPKTPEEKGGTLPLSFSVITELSAMVFFHSYS